MGDELSVGGMRCAGTGCRVARHAEVSPIGSWRAGVDSRSERLRRALWVTARSRDRHLGAADGPGLLPRLLVPFALLKGEGRPDSDPYREVGHPAILPDAPATLRATPVCVVRAVCVRAWRVVR
jgi:hypothetical protein